MSKAKHITCTKTDFPKGLAEFWYQLKDWELYPDYETHKIALFVKHLMKGKYFGLNSDNTINQQITKLIELIYKYDAGTFKNQEAIREKLSEIMNFTTAKQFEECRKELKSLFLGNSNNTIN